MSTINTKVIRTDKAEVFLVENDWLVKMIIDENTDLEKNDIIQLDAAKRELTLNKKHCVLFVPPLIGSINKDARDHAATDEINEGAIAKAIIANTIANRILGNFFIVMNKPKAPTRLFSSEPDALKWLKEMYVKSM